MPTLQEMEQLWAADFQLRQIPLRRPVLPNRGKIVGTVEYDREKGILEVAFFDKDKENPPRVGG